MISNLGLTHVISYLLLGCDFAMRVEVTEAGPNAIGADLVAAAGRRASELGAPERALAEADPVAMVYAAAAAPLAVVALEPDVEGLRTGAAHAVRACRGG